MIYGDNPTKMNGILVPNMAAIGQSGNLYVYAVNNPIMFRDESGEFIITAIVIGAVVAKVGAVTDAKGITAGTAGVG